VIRYGQSDPALFRSREAALPGCGRSHRVEEHGKLQEGLEAQERRHERDHEGVDQHGQVRRASLQVEPREGWGEYPELPELGHGTEGARGGADLRSGRAQE